MVDERGDGPVQEYRIEGALIDGIEDLYAQLNALLMHDEGWELGASLDALDDALYRFSPRTGSAVFVWADHEQSRRVLGRAATQAWLEDKLRCPDAFNDQRIRAQLDELAAGEGKTYFEIVEEVFASHSPDVRLDLD